MWFEFEKLGKVEVEKVLPCDEGFVLSHGDTEKLSWIVGDWLLVAYLVDLDLDGWVLTVYIDLPEELVGSENDCLTFEVISGIENLGQSFRL